MIKHRDFVIAVKIAKKWVFFGKNFLIQNEIISLKQ